ncbi:MAG: lipoprotein signal peptidase [candidate division TA06 bacterium ADurb.Bin417]|uniref:Lipoprotein signal peptidase n=1 Tax=candidate division TA06 bacterium ADurb.Bin417 TaxID=1852828 RepID=A0A1V5MDX5_UNCT6|nr:MAG: lipoprotein signal peptidase [candidate division TA06 bacterium ADurb.Bin417]
MAGNLTDRLLSGAVFDFLLLFPIPLFNLADLFLTAGALLILFPVFFVERQRIRV